MYLTHSIQFCHSFRFSLLRTFALLLVCASYCQSQHVPTRPIDLWNPFGTTTPPRLLPGQKARDDEVIVQLTIGSLIGRRLIIPNVTWTATKDPREQIPNDRGPRDPDPLPPKNNVTVFTFLGIPYSEPPTGNLRFKAPQRMVNLPGEQPYQANAFGPACAQDTETRSTLNIKQPYPWLVNEDCLYLNIFTPDASRMSGATYPVIVFFHGGAFQTGSANDWPGHVLASKGIVVVTVNYRLGPFGFLSLGDSLTGNYGLEDQRLALEWVRDHISAFGGDPLQVTVVGHGAGAVSVGLHMMSPGSMRLFRAAAALSGADVAYDQVITYPSLAFNNTIGLGRYLGCSEATAESVWNCIQTRSTPDIIQAAVDSLRRVQFNRYGYLPTVDKRVIPDEPKKFLEDVVRGAATLPSPVPYLTGVNQNDGTQVLLADRKLGEYNKFLLVDQMYVSEFVLEYAYRHNYTTNREVVADAIEQRYKYWPDPSDNVMIRQKFLELASDTYYVAPVSLSAHLHSSAGSRTFMYVNNYNFSKGALNQNQSFLPSWMGVCHECDLYMLFGFPWMPKRLLPPRFREVNWTETDKNASEAFMTIFRQFARTQNPNFPHDSTWTPLDPRRHWYVDFNYTTVDDQARPGILRRDYKWEAVAFWNEFIPSLADFFTTTFSPTEATFRREAEAFKIVTGATLLILMLVLVFAGAVSYLYFERGRRSRAREPPLVVVPYTDSRHNGSYHNGEQVFEKEAQPMTMLVTHKTTNL
uniref:Carboxylesterase type B domain-containing protein n=1 Tax=Plectus sambesii TaxID=2011161 RepID=A0A914VWW6_9BILA